jgi:hypothetical protein
MLNLVDRQSICGMDLHTNLITVIDIETQSIPAQLQNKSLAQIFEDLFSTSVGPLIAAMVSTFG